MKNFLLFGSDKSIYNEFPVDIDTFIENDFYLGKSTRNGERIYPFWRQTLRKMFDTENPNKYKEMFVATACGTGKSVVSTIAFIYTLYCFMCLKDPNDFFKFFQEDKCAFIIFSCNNFSSSITKNTFLEYIRNSQWFNTHGNFTYEENKSFPETYNPITNIEIIYANKPDDIYGVQVLGANFSYDCTKFEQSQTLKIYNSIYSRLVSRTTLDGIKYGKMITDFELFNSSTSIKITELKAEDLDVLTVTGSQFLVRPPGTFDYSDSFFVVYDGIIGHSKVVTKNDIVFGERLEKDYKFISCPISMLDLAKLDTDTFLLNICGIQLKSDSEYATTFTDAFKSLMFGKAIMFDGDDFYFVAHEDEKGSICAYDKDTDEQLWSKAGNFFTSLNKASKYILEPRWKIFENPLKSIKKGDDNDE